MTTSIARSDAPARALVDRSAADSRIRRRTFALQLVVLVGWAGATLVLAVLATLLTFRGLIDDPLIPILTFAAIVMTALSPFGVWAGRVIKQRDSAARMALVPADDPELDGLAPGLRALLADARLTRSAIEGREFDDEVALRAVWEWLQRLAELPEAERRELEGLGLDERSVAETLRWTIAAPAHGERGLALIAEQLDAFERGLLTAARGPYR